jgi:beta-lactamase regulating signal transducer with metallopeptidase domain
VIEHLVVSTIVLAVAMAAAQWLPLTARTRYALLFCGIAKFAVPTAVFRLLPAAVMPAALRTFGGAAVIPTTPAAARIDWIPIAWGAIALLLIARWWLLRTRTIAAAFRDAAPASQRELDAIHDARVTMHIRGAVDAIRSPICEAPAVLRVVRPVIALPARGCDALTDDELRSLVLHECAHIARHDNLAATAQAAATSLLWFHPLVWMASRALTFAREEACDEAVADAIRDPRAYVSALTKIGQSVVAPRTAGASCMASAKIRERMEHLMSYESIKTKAWPHRLMFAIAVVLIGASTIAVAGPSAPQSDKYAIAYTVDPNPGSFTFELNVTEIATGEVVSHPRLTTPPGVTIQSRSSSHGRNVKISAIPNADGSGHITLDVEENDSPVQHTVIDYAPGAAPRKYTGEPLSINVKNADIHDILGTLGDLTGLTFDVAADVQGSVTLNVRDVPWDKVLDDMLRVNGLEGKVDGKTIHVTKMSDDAAQ